MARKIVILIIFLLNIAIPTVMANPIDPDDTPIPQLHERFLVWAMFYIAPIALFIVVIILIGYYANKKFSKKKSIGLTS